MMKTFRRGAGKPVVLVHGLADTSRDWDGILPGLVEAGFCAYLMDLPGHGESAPAEKPSDYTITYVMDAIETWVDSLDLKSPILWIGHSLGGYICLEYARRHPARCEQMILISPLFSPRQLSPVIYHLLRRTKLTEKALQLAPIGILTNALRLSPLIQAPIPPHLCHQKAQDFKRADPAVMRIPASIMDLTVELNSIQVPTFVIWGQNDLTLNPALFSELVLRLPFASGRALKHTGHQPHIQCPELVLPLILEFLFQKASI